MSTRRTRRTAAAAETTEEIVTVVETRASKRTRAPTRRAAATSKKSTTTKSERETTPPNTTSRTRNAQPATRSDAVASTPATKRRLRSDTEAASPLRALEEQPAKRPRTTSRKASANTPAPAQPPVIEEDDSEEVGVFFTKSEHDFLLLQTRNTKLEATCNTLRVEVSQLRARIVELEEQLHQHTSLKTSPVNANLTRPEFDSFDVDQSDAPQSSFATGDESAVALLRHVQEAAKAPKATSPPREPEILPAPESSTPAASERPATPSKSLFSSFTSPFTAIKNLFGSSTPAPPSPTPSRQPPADTFTEVLSMPPTPVGERPKRPANKKAKKPSRLVKALLKGIDQQDVDKATEWANRVAVELQNDSDAGQKRKRLEAPVLFRDLQHFPSSKPWQSGFSFPEDVLDLEDDDVVPAWAVYTSMVEEEHCNAKRTKINHTTATDNDMPASLNEVFGTSTSSTLDLTPRRSIEPSPMFETPLHHREGSNIFKELRGHDAAVHDRENLQRELKAGISQHENKVETHDLRNAEGLHRAHDPTHGSFSVPESDSEGDDDEEAQPLWTQAPPPAPTPAHAPLPAANHSEEVERQRQKLMKHTPHKPSRLQQVSYPSPSLISDAGESPLKAIELLGDIPQVEPIVFDDPVLDAALEAISTSEGLQAKLSSMHWSQPTVTYDSEEEELSPI